MDQPRKVILISSEPEMASYLASYIPLLGPFEPEHASTGMEILAMTNAYEPALLIFHPAAVNQDTLKTLREIRQKHGNVKILAVANTQGDRSLFAEEGMENIITRPFDLTDLSQQVKKLLPHEDKSQSQPTYARLLVADDEEAIREILVDTFSPMGIEVYTAGDGQEALEVFKNKICNLAIVDLRMPQMNGAELAKFLEDSTNPPKPKLLIIVTAALGDTLQEVKRLGYPVMAKPMDLESIEKVILGACQKFDLTLKDSLPD